MNWLISANSKLYDHTSSFEHYGFIDWRQGNTRYEIGDCIYIYCTSPLKKIRYKCKVENKNMTFDKIRDDKEYWKDLVEYKKSLNGKFMKLTLIEQVDNEQLNLENLLGNGLKAAPQGPKKLDGNLLKYIESRFNDLNQNEIFPEMINQEIDTYEGIKKQITVNKYERSSIARAKCIEFHGVNCIVCGINFKEKYGKIGEGFIHIHHIVPVYKIGKEYKVDYKKDLVPVCPNCHAMLHRLIDGKELSIDKLRNLLKETSK
jgi:5-methylcytosine-specific restriction enzyme A